MTTERRNHTKYASPEEAAAARKAYMREYHKKNGSKYSSRKKEYFKKRYAENREIILAKAKVRYQEKREELLAYAEKYREENRDKFIELRRRWYDQNVKEQSRKMADAIVTTFGYLPEGRRKAYALNLLDMAHTDRVIKDAVRTHRVDSLLAEYSGF
ncbi:hypothetical protein [Brucella intermedia]|uniref:hypothetical protein n=1 Tax=Brucella intermedia TaxID=94625 RepID=UPI00224A646C|nr:hypothetical protein [Brucella intermedia]